MLPFLYKKWKVKKKETIFIRAEQIRHKCVILRGKKNAFHITKPLLLSNCASIKIYLKSADRIVNQRPGRRATPLSLYRNNGQGVGLTPIRSIATSVSNSSLQIGGHRLFDLKRPKTRYAWISTEYVALACQALRYSGKKYYYTFSPSHLRNETFIKFLPDFMDFTWLFKDILVEVWKIIWE